MFKYGFAVTIIENNEGDCNELFKYSKAIADG